MQFSKDGDIKQINKDWLIWTLFWIPIILLLLGMAKEFYHYLIVFGVAISPLPLYLIEVGFIVDVIFDEEGIVFKSTFSTRRYLYSDFVDIKFVLFPALDKRFEMYLGYDVPYLCFYDIPLELKYDASYKFRLRKSKKNIILSSEYFSVYEYLLQHLDEEKSAVLKHSYEVNVLNANKDAVENKIEEHKVQ